MCHPVRFLLEYTGTSYEEKVYGYGPAPEYPRPEWKSDKFSLGLELPNLPYYIDGDFKLTQSYAIMRYIGRKHGLCGRTEREMAKIDMLMDHGRDMHMAFGELCYGHYSPEAKKEYLIKLESNFKFLSNMLGRNSWFIGGKISLADFVFYEELIAHQALESTCLDSFQTLKDFQKRFEDLPAIKKYMHSQNVIKYPFNGPTAKVLG